VASSTPSASRTITIVRNYGSSNLCGLVAFSLLGRGKAHPVFFSQTMVDKVFLRLLEKDPSLSWAVLDATHFPFATTWEVGNQRSELRAFAFVLNDSLFLCSCFSPSLYQTVSIV